jgi:uncharacterized protein
VRSTIVRPTLQGTRFPFEGPVPPQLLIDRTDELDLLARRAADRVSVRLVAPRRYGKTSILLAHGARLRDTGWRTTHVDLGGVADLTDVARRFAAAYAELDSHWMRAHLAAPLARIGLTLSGVGPGVSLALRPATTDTVAAETILEQLLDQPRRLWEADRVPTLVVLDEFQDLLVARKDLDAVLRARIQYHGDVAAYVYAGSEPSMLRDLFDTRERPFFGQADPLELGPLPIQATLTDLAARFAGEGLEPGEALADLVLFAGGHPQRTMLLAYLLAERLEQGAEGVPALGAAVVDAAIERSAAAHEALWRQLGRSERAVLAGVADGVAPSSRALATEHRVARRTLELAARRLADQGHLVRQPRATTLVDPLLAEWLRRR